MYVLLISEILILKSTTKSNNQHRRYKLGYEKCKINNV